VPEVLLPARPGAVEIDYSSAAEGVRYQYKLEGGGDNGVWGPPTSQQVITLVNLSPGRYRFFVRAMDVDGTVGEEPATVAFAIQAALWRRWWFLALAGTVLAALTYGAHRFRLARLLQVEHVRARIATDLHDDIGSSLSRIAILSELAMRRDGRDPEVRTALASIGHAARELVDSMSDIVWAIDPRRDELEDLAGRMRRFASDMLAARDIAFDFAAPESARSVRLAPDVRREVFLVFKEAIHNVVRHAGCARVEISLRIDGRYLEVVVSDDGRGLDPGLSPQRPVPHRGHGLKSLQARAGRLGGNLQLISRPGEGTTVHLRLPLHHASRWACAPATTSASASASVPSRDDATPDSSGDATPTSSGGEARRREAL
jgi:signal transduction histidine kinase